MIHDSQASSGGTDAGTPRCCTTHSDHPASHRASRAARWMQEQRRPAACALDVGSDPSPEVQLPDVQATPDRREIRIDRVGISALRHPITVTGRGGAAQRTVGTFRMTVALPAERKGTHMSRFLQVLGGHADALGPAGLVALTRAVRDRLDAPEAQVDVSFPYFIAKPAPVTGLVGMMDYEVSMACVVGAERVDLTIALAASATSLCPCSKLISAYGAHNQRCRIVATVRLVDEDVERLPLDDLASIVESAASAEVYSVLKRPDEKFVTERAYEQPKFVEDIIRDLALALDADARIASYRITSENFESIHAHNAFAEIVRGCSTTA